MPVHTGMLGHSWQQNWTTAGALWLRVGVVDELKEQVPINTPTKVKLGAITSRAFPEYRLSTEK